MTTPTTKKRKRLETTLAAAVAHPIRSKCLVILAERVASPVEIARELRLDVSKVGYHVNGLRDAKLIEEVGQRPVRGTVEHFYRAVQLPVVTFDQEEELTEQERRVYAESVWSIVAANATHALETGAFLDRTDHHLTRLAFTVDEQGWKEATAAYMELYERIFEIQEAAAERLGASDEKPFRVVSFQALFEIPPTGEKPGTD
jgi:DNA-binding transcriptional ArsR family regulator